MANKIRGITVEIGGDTTGLTKALKQVNSEIKSTQSQLKDVEKLLKLDPGNTELLTQKQQLLAQTVSETKEKLSALKQAEEKLKEAGVDENSAQFMALKREIIDTENSLKSAEKAAGSFSVSLAKASSAAKDLSDKAAVVAQKTKVLSAAAAGVITGLAGAAYSAVQASDELNTLAKQSGLTTAEIQKMNYAADIVDVSSDTIIGALKKMRKNMNSTSSDVQAAWDRIGVSAKDANGEFRDSTEVFYEVLEGLSNIENETERDIVAMSLFGKSADELAGIIDDGGAALKAMGEEAENLGLIMDQDTLDSLNAVNDQIDRLKAQAKATLAQSGAKAMEALLPVFEKVTAAISKLLEWIGSLNTEQLETILTIAAIVAAISPVAGIISKISGAVGTLLDFLPTLQTMFSAVTGFLAANPWVLIAAAVAAAVILIIQNWDTIKEKAAQLVAWINEHLVEPWKQIWATIKEVCVSIFESVVTFISNKWEAIKEKAGAFISWIKDHFIEPWRNAWNNVKEIFSGVFGALEGIAKSPLNAIIGFINKVISGINSFINKINSGGFAELLGAVGLKVNLPTIPSIPALAKGGILSKGTALVGEAGPELLTLSNGRAIVQPLSADMEGLTGALNTLTGSLSQDAPINIVVQSVLDGRVIGETAYRYSLNRARMHGT